MKKFFNGEVFFILFLFAGAYKVSFEEYLPTWIDLTVLFMVLSMAYGIKNVLIRGLHKTLLLPVVLMLGFVLITIASLLYVETNPYSITKTLTLVSLTFWSFIGPFLLVDYSNPKLSLKRFFGTILFIGITMSIVAISSYVTDGATSTVALGTNNYLHLGRVAGLSALILLTCLLFRENLSRIRRYWVLLVSVVTLIALFISGGRMPVISFGVALLLVLARGINFKEVKTKKEIVIKKKTLAMSYIGIWTLPFIVNLIAESNFFNRFLAFFQENGGRSAGQRVYSFDIALDMIRDSNLMGYGIGSFLNFSGGLEARSYPHNIFLEVLAELGIVGFILLISILVMALYRYFKYYNISSYYSVVILVTAFFFFLNALVSGDINDNRFLFFALALMLMSKVFSNHRKGNEITQNEENDDPDIRKVEIKAIN